MTDAGRTRMRRRTVGFVFQKFNLLPTLSAIGNIEIAYDISGRKEPMDRAYLDHLSDLLSIRGRLQHRPSELSGGEQQRVAIARAVIGKPSLVIADEPTSSLDTDRQQAFLELLFEVCDEAKATLVFVSHDRSLMTRFDEQIALSEVSRVCA